MPEPYSDNDSDFNCSEANKKLIVLFGHLLRLQNDAFNSHEFIVKTNDLTHQLWVKTVYKKFKSFIELQQPRKPWQIFLRTPTFRLSNKDCLMKNRFFEARTNLDFQLWLRQNRNSQPCYTFRIFSWSTNSYTVRVWLEARRSGQVKS